MLALIFIGWVLLMIICTYFTICGTGLLLFGMLLHDGETSLIGAIILACALTGLYNTSEISPFKVTVDTHIYQEHK